jgi:hypothetical protein
MSLRLWDVPVCRTGYGHATIRVEADTEEEAVAEALEVAGDHTYTEHDSDYCAVSGAYPVAQIKP